MRRISTLELLTRLIVEEFHTRTQLGLFEYENRTIQPKSAEAKEIAEHSRQCKKDARVSNGLVYTKSGGWRILFTREG